MEHQAEAEVEFHDEEATVAELKNEALTEKRVHEEQQHEVDTETEDVSEKQQMCS